MLNLGISFCTLCTASLLLIPSTLKTYYLYTFGEDGKKTQEKQKQCAQG